MPNRSSDFDPKKVSLVPCPWCGEKPCYRIVTSQQNYDHAGNYYPEVKELPTEIISCMNVAECKVRPELIRVNSGDAVQIWNDVAALHAFSCFASSNEGLKQET